MKSRFIFSIAMLAAVALFAAIINRSANTFNNAESENERQPGEGKTGPVILELFTSEGCSSCPPADELLMRLDGSQEIAGAEIIALSEHVDYWNRLGWADPYSSADFSERQSQYAKIFDRDDVYTPQMVVDGREEFVGSNAARARQAVSAAARLPKADVTLNRKTESVITVHIENMPKISAGDKAEVILALTESNLRSQVLRGENSGRRLSHTAVARRLSVIGSLDSQKMFDTETSLRIESSWKRENLKAVVFVQERASRHVLGAATIRLAEKE